MEFYGKELIMDLHSCDPKTFGRRSLRRYFKEICELIDMERCDLHFWDDVGVAKKYRQTEAHTKGTSAIQFILTSNITIHTLPLLQNAYVNVFSCKDFIAEDAIKFTRDWFHGEIVQHLEIDRL